MGKTYLAEVIAEELRAPLVQVEVKVIYPSLIPGPPTDLLQSLAVPLSRFDLCRRWQAIMLVEESAQHPNMKHSESRNAVGFDRALQDYSPPVVIVKTASWNQLYISMVHRMQVIVPFSGSWSNSAPLWRTMVADGYDLRLSNDDYAKLGNKKLNGAQVRRENVAIEPYSQTN